MTDIDLPVNVDLERMVLGSVLVDEALMHSARPVLNSEDFSQERHRRFWKHACELYDAGKPVDRITIYSALRDHGEAEHDTLSYLVSLDEGLPALPAIDSYVQILKDESARRRIIAVGHSLIQRAVKREAPQGIIDSMGQMAMDLVPQDGRRGLISARQLVDRVGIESILSPRISRGLAFPWPWLTNATCGMLAGELWVLAGHTSTGKSSAAIQTAVHAARSGKRVAIFSLEMVDVSVFQRALWQISRVDSEKAKRGALNADETRRAGEAANLLYEAPLYFDDSAFSVMEIHARLRSLRGTGTFGLVVVDYLQLLRDAGRHSSRAEAVGANARALKLMAGEFGCPVLLLSQFSRESAKQGRRPELTDLKESGDIENHANGVWFIHRERQQDQDQVPVEFLLPKQRDGRRNVMSPFWFMPRFQRFDAKTTELMEDA